MMQRIAVVCGRYRTFLGYNRDNGDKNVQLIPVMKMEDIDGREFDSYVELYDSHEIKDYGWFINALKHRIKNDSKRGT